METKRIEMSYKDDLYINKVLKLLFLIKYVITSKLKTIEKRFSFRS